jgi:hypothetical protein
MNPRKYFTVSSSVVCSTRKRYCFPKYLNDSPLTYSRSLCFNGWTSLKCPMFLRIHEPFDFTKSEIKSNGTRSFAVTSMVWFHIKIDIFYFFPFHNKINDFISELDLMFFHAAPCLSNVVEQPF